MTAARQFDTRSLPARLAARRRSRLQRRPHGKHSPATSAAARQVLHPGGAGRERPGLSVLQVGSAPAAADSRGGIASVIAAVLDLPNHRDDVEVEHITTYRDTDRKDQARVAASGLTRLRSVLRTRRPDVVHVHVSYKGSVLRKAAVLRLARAARVPTVLHAHSHGFKKWFDSLRPPARAVVKRALVADHWIVLGHALRDEYVDMFGLDPAIVHVVPNPVVGAVPEASGAPRGEPVPGAPLTGLFLGRLGRRKGCYELLEALAKVDADTRGSRPGVRIVMAGDGDIDRMRAEASRLGVAHLVDFPGWIGPDDRFRLLAEADFFVLPSYEEGLPMALLESMGSGLPVIVTPVGAIGEVIRDGENGLLVPPGDAAALAEAMSRLTKSDQERRALGAAARVTAAEYDVEPWYDTLLELWQEVAAPAYRWTTGALPKIDRTT